MEKINNAIIMAAGFGSRLQPITNTTPKPLISVCGEVIIENIISAIKSKGIEQIVVVVGYKAEQFEYLADKYGVTLVQNPDYAIANNISSMYYAREYLGGTLVIDGDQLVKNRDIVQPKIEKSGYCCYYVQGHTDEWLLKLNNTKVVECSRTGGEDGWELKGLSYWTKADGEQLRELVKQEYESGNTNIYWDDVAMFVRKGEIELYGYPINDGDIIEIDNLAELQQMDKKYRDIRCSYVEESR